MSSMISAQPCDLSTPTPVAPGTTTADALFGSSLAADAGILVIGAPGDSTAGINAGAVHIAACNTAGCGPTQRLVGSTAGLFDQLGASVAISDSIIVAGAPSDDPFGVRTGSASVFERTNGTWGATATLVPSGLGAFAGAGSAVAVSGTTAIVATPGDTATGSVAVFVRESVSVWTQVARLAPTQQLSGFGAAVAIEGDLLAVGAPSFAASGISSGAAVLYRRSGAAWFPEATLVPPDASAGDRFGAALAVSGGAVIVGAPLDDTLGPDTGAVFVFRKNAGGWEADGTLHHPSAQPNDRFGSAVAAEANAATVGTDRSFIASDATVFRGTAGSWNHEATLALPGATEPDAFACSIAMDAGAVAVGALGTGSNAGAAHRFDLGQCGPACPADVNGDGLASPADFGAWVAAYNAQSPLADQNGDGLITPSDFGAWVANYNAGC